MSSVGLFLTFSPRPEPIYAILLLTTLTAALIYNGINSTVDVYRGHVHDVYGSMGAAALTGLIWRSTGASFPRIVSCERLRKLTPRLLASQLASSQWS